MDAGSASNQQGGDDTPVEVGIMLAGANREVVHDLNHALVQKGCNVDFLDYLDAGTSQLAAIDQFANSKNFVLWVATPEGLVENTRSEQERHIIQYASFNNFRFAAFIPKQCLNINLPPSIAYKVPLKEDRWFSEKLDKTLMSIRNDMRSNRAEGRAANAAEVHDNPLANLPPVSDLAPKLDSTTVSEPPTNYTESSSRLSSQGQSVDPNSARVQSNEAKSKTESSLKRSPEKRVYDDNKDGTPV